jgi:hypothetical protein
MSRYRFRIINRGQKVAIQCYLDPDDEAVAAGYASPGWGPLVTGYASVDEAKTAFIGMYATQDIQWDSEDSGSFRSFEQVTA